MTPSCPCGRPLPAHCPRCRACVAADHWCDGALTQPPARALLAELRAMPGVSADLDRVDAAPGCDNDTGHRSEAWLTLSWRGDEWTFCADCGRRFVGFRPHEYLDVTVLAVVPAPVAVNV